MNPEISRRPHRPARCRPQYRWYGLLLCCVTPMLLACNNPGKTTVLRLYNGPDFLAASASAAELRDQNSSAFWQRFQIEAALYDNLVALDAVTGQIQPGLAVSWKLTEDNTALQIRLGARTWSDGRKMTAEHVIAGWQDYLLGGASQSEVAAHASLLDKAIALDAQTIELQPAAGSDAQLLLLGLSTAAFAVRPPAKLLAVPASDRRVIPAWSLSSGPFRLSGEASLPQLRLEGNPRYNGRLSGSSGKLENYRLVFEHAAAPGESSPDRFHFDPASFDAILWL